MVRPRAGRGVRRTAPIVPGRVSGTYPRRTNFAGRESDGVKDRRLAVEDDLFKVYVFAEGSSVMARARVGQIPLEPLRQREPFLGAVERLEPCFDEPGMYVCLANDRVALRQPFDGVGGGAVDRVESHLP